MAQQVNRFTKADKLLVISAFLIAVALIIFINLFLYNGVATGVEIQFDGKPYATYSFSELPDEKTLEINTNIGYNIIRIVDNTVVVTESSCEDGICKAVVLTKPNQTVVCLPNKILIRLTGDADIDSISY